MSMKEHVDLLVDNQGPKVRHSGVCSMTFYHECFTVRKSSLLVPRVAQWSAVSGEELRGAQGSQDGESSP